MRKIIAITHVTLDGVMQAPGGPEEDASGGFTHGGWTVPFRSEAGGKAIGEMMAGEFDMLLGRRTYDIFAGYWPKHGDNPIGKAFNKATKYVITHRSDPLPWENSQRLDSVEQVGKLKASDGPELHTWGGSSQLLQALTTAELVPMNITCGSFRWCSARESGCSRMAFCRAASPCSISSAIIWVELNSNVLHRQSKNQSHLPRNSPAPSPIVVIN